jgi:hypothetical protein
VSIFFSKSHAAVWDLSRILVALWATARVQCSF